MLKQILTICVETRYLNLEWVISLSHAAVHSRREWFQNQKSTHIYDMEWL